MLDEVGALFGKRSDVRDAHDRRANIEISYLLERIEDFAGVVILATNLRENLDEAFMQGSTSASALDFAGPFGRS